jgi:hypothetical protein
MYSVLIKVGSSLEKYSYLLNSDGTIYTANDLETIGAKIAEMLETYTLSQMKVVKNCTITNNITIEEVEA